MSGTEIFRRRDVLAGAGAAAATLAVPGIAAAQTPRPIPVIDTHTHLYDTTRPQGAPYPASNQSMPPKFLPADYRAAARPVGVVGVIAVEASHWLEDNLWLLETAQTDTMLVGVIGNLQPEKPDFGEYLTRFAKNPLFRGFRYRATGNLAQVATTPAFIDGLKRLVDADLVAELGGLSAASLELIARISDQVPNLRIIIDHMAGATPAPEAAAAVAAGLNNIKGRPNVFGKVSQVINTRQPSLKMEDHKAWLDQLAEAFGEDRVMYGSDFPNIISMGKNIHDSVTLMRAWNATRPAEAQEKFFWRNSGHIYKWVKRAPDQPTA